VWAVRLRERGPGPSRNLLTCANPHRSDGRSETGTRSAPATLSGSSMSLCVR